MYTFFSLLNRLSNTIFFCCYFLITTNCWTDGKYLVLPSGELHIREVGPEDGYKSYQCRTKHRLTGEARLSATKGRLVITGMNLRAIHNTQIVFNKTA